MIVPGKMKLDSMSIAYHFKSSLIKCLWTAGSLEDLYHSFSVLYMATTSSSNEEIAEAFTSFPFATDQEYQVSNSCCSRWGPADGFNPYP